jgi:hypothetical protein
MGFSMLTWQSIRPTSFLKKESLELMGAMEVTGLFARYDCKCAANVSMSRARRASPRAGWSRPVPHPYSIEMLQYDAQQMTVSLKIFQREL